MPRLPVSSVKKLDKLRLEPLQDTQLPVLILQGQRDALGSEDEIQIIKFQQSVKFITFLTVIMILKPRVKQVFSNAHKLLAAQKIKGFISEND